MGDGIQVALDVRQTLIDVVTVGLLQIGNQPRHVGSENGRRARHKVVERIDVADEQEKTGVHTAALAHVGYRAVTEAQRDAQPCQQGQQRRVSGNQIAQAAVTREKS